MQGESDEDQFQRGLALQNQGRFAEAAAVYEPLAARVLTLKLAINLGISLGELGEREGAIRYLSLAAGHSPANAVLRRMLGFAFSEAGRIAEAERELREALALAPGDKPTELALGGLLLSVGRYAEGWPLLRARGEVNPGVVPKMTALAFPEWTGEPLAGKSILVWVEQGFGDKIQMARFVALLRAQGAQVTLGCNPPLTHLFSTLAGVDRLVPISVGESITVDRHDFWTRYFSLPDYLAITLETLPAAPYLAAPDDRRAKWAGFAPQVGRPARIGLVSQASPTGFNAGNKGLRPEDARRLTDLGAISLHPEDTGAADFADTAAILETLDLVISIDTSVAHLAGAMGKPCWTLLPFNKCDWRWLRDRSDSPWYPTMRLYRAGKPFDWTPTIDAVIADLVAEDLR